MSLDHAGDCGYRICVHARPALLGFHVRVQA